MKRVLMLLLIFVVGVFFGLFVLTEAIGATAPSWVANVPGTGFVPCYETAATEHGLSTIEVTATADLTFSVWAYDGTAWSKIVPKWGAAAGDTMLFVPSGVTKSFRFPSPRATAVFVNGGDGYWSGE